MAKKADRSTKITALRRQAEERLRVTQRDVAAMPVKDVQKLVQDLQVHQVELEIQNDELRRTQVELEVARDRYAALYDGAPIGYLTLDLKGVVLLANLPACTLLGINRKYLLGQPVMRYVAANDRSTFLDHLRDTFNSEISHACEVDLAQQNGVVVRFESVVVSDEVGAHSVAQTALLDITARVRAEAQVLVQTRERLAHNLHDGILQPIFAIGLGLETCIRDIAENPGRAAAVLTQGIGALNSAMQEVRTFMTELGSEPVLNTALPARALSGLLSRMAEDLARLHGKNVRLSVRRAVTTGLSCAQDLDILKLAKEALSNSLRHAQVPIVFVSLRCVDGTTRLTVQDHGSGFSLKEKMGQGQGLLNITARAEQLGGTLSVRSQPGIGTTVIFDLQQKTTAITGHATKIPVIASPSDLRATPPLRPRRRGLSQNRRSADSLRSAPPNLAFLPRKTGQAARGSSTVRRALRKARHQPC